MRGKLIWAAALVLALAPPGAQAATPVPGCSGLLVTDEAGETEVGGLDILAVWADFADGVATVNVRIADLALEVAAMDTFRAYDLGLNHNGDSLSMRASIDAAGQTGFWAWTTNPYVATPIEGEFFLGENGVVRFELPGIEAGDVLTSVGVATREFQGHPAVGGFYSPGDDAGSSLKKYVVGSCAPPEPPVAVAAPVPGPAPTAPPAAAPTPAAAALPVSVGRVTRRGKALNVRNTTHERIAGLRARLVGSRGVVASGRSPSLAGRGVLRLASRRRLAAGRYTLRLTGTVAGAQRTLAVAIRVPR